MSMLKRMLQLNLSAKEVAWSKRILASVMLPILVFYMLSVNILMMGIMKAEAADGSGYMTINKDTVAAGGTQTYKLTFNPTESMDTGSVEVTVPTGWTAPVDGNTSLTVISGATFGSLDFSGQKITVPVTLMASNQGFYLTLTSFVAPIATGDYTFTTKSKITVDGSLRGISGDPTVTVTAGAVDHYAISAISSPKTVGVNFDVTVTAKDVNNNTTVGSGTVAISVQTGSGALVGDTSADTTGDGIGTVTLKYNKAENDVVLRASADGKTGDSNDFDVANIAAPNFSPAGTSSTNDSTPLVNWSDVFGTGIAYNMQLIAKTTDTCVNQDYSESLLDKNTGETSQYQMAADEALLDETSYCVQVTTTAAYGESVYAYKQFNLLTSKPEAPDMAYIPTDTGANGHPENHINIYNNENASVKVYHATNLDGGKVYVKLTDDLGNETSLYSVSIVGATDNTTITGIDAGSLQQGDNLDINARVEDAGTNSSDWSYATNSTDGEDDWIVKDINPPAKPSAVAFVDNPVNIANKNAVNINVTGEGLTEAYYSVTSAGGGAAVTGHFTLDEDGDTNSPNINVTSLGDGTLTALVYLVDSAWNHSSAKTGSVIKDATAPNVALSYDLNRLVKDADTLRITATFNEAVKDAPIPQIAIDFAGGAGSDIAATNMTKTDATHYYYDANVPSGSDGTATVTISNTQDLFGNGNNAATGNTFTVDNTNPAISFTNDVAAGPLQSDTIRITVTEANADASSYKYIFADNNTCNDKDYSGGVAYTSASDFVINDQTHNGKYICAKAVDRAGNASYQASANQLNIDITGPTLAFSDNVAIGPVQSDTITPNWGDATVMKWDYDADGVCSAVAGSYFKTNANSMDQNTETNNGKYICMYAEDTLGNKTTLASANPINIDITAPTIIITNPDATPSQNKTITASATESATKYYAVNNAENNTCDGSLAFSDYTDITFSTEADNGKKVCYKAVDTAGNVAYSLSAAIVGIDRTAPDKPTITGVATDSGIADGITSDNTLLINGAAEANSTVTLYRGGILVGTIEANGAGNWSYDYTGATLADGAYNFTAVSSDAAGNASATSDAYSVTVDTAAPSKPVIIGISNDSGAIGDHITNDNTLFINGTAEANSSVEVFRGASSIGTVFANGAGNWSYDYTGATLADGAYNFTAVSSDAAGNASATSDAYSVTVDTAAPAAPIISHIAGDEKISNSEKDAIIAMGTAEANSTINVSLSDAGNVHTISGSGAATGGNFSITIDGTILNDGTITPSVTATDAAGNTSVADTDPTALKDAVIPTLTAVHIQSSNASNTVAKQGNIITLTLTASEALAANPTVAIAGHSVSATNTGGNNYSASYTLTSSDTEGAVAFTVDFTDPVGNAGTRVTSTTDASSVNYDKTDPTTNITSPTTGSYKSGNFTFSGIASDGNGVGLAKVELRIKRSSDDKYWKQSTGNWVISSDTAWNLTTGTEAWTFDYTGGIADITYTIDAKAMDNAGNYTIWQHYFTITVHGDTNEPTSAVTSPANGSYVNSIAALLGTAGDPNGTNKSGVQKVEISIKNETTEKYWKSNNTWDDGESYLATSYSAGNWTKDGNLPAWESGKNYTVHSKSTDNAGNIQFGNGASTFLFDNAAPTVVLSDDHADSIVRDADTVVITATFTEADQINETSAPRITIHSANLVDNALMSKTSNLVWTYTWNVPVGNDGAHTVSILAQDRAGNASAAAAGKTSYTIDNTNPTVSISNPANGQYKKGTFTITADASDNAGGSGLAKVEFYEGANKLGEDTDAAGGYTYDWATGHGNDGAHALTAIATDVAGNSIISSTVNITVDNTAPTATAVTDPTAGQYKKGTFTITATAADAIGVQKLEFYDGDPGAGGTLLGTDTTSPYSYDWATSAADNGAHTLYSKAYDNAGNTLVSSGVAITVDNTAPDAPTFNSPQNADTWYNSNPSLDVDFSDNIKINTIEYKVDSGGTFRTIASDVNAATYTDNWLITGGDWTAMTQGTHHLYFRVTDYAGNQYITPDDGSGFRFKKDVTAPTAPTYNIAEDQWFAGNPTLDIDFSDNQSLKKVEYQVDGSAGSWTTLADNISGLNYADNWSMDVSIWNGLGDGIHYLYFRVTDYAGNVYIAPDNAAGFTFKKDTTAPSAISGMTIDPAENTWTTDTALAFNWDDSTDIGGSGLSGYSYVVDHTADTTPDATVESATSAYTTGALADGNDWYFHVKAIDKQGNATATVRKGPFKIDTAAPDISHTAVTTANVGDEIEINATLNDNDGSGISEARLYWRINSGSWNDSAMSDIGGDNYRKTLDARTNPDDTVKYYIKSADDLGNYIYKYDSGEGTNEAAARSNAYVIDIISTVNKFTVSSDTSQTDGSPFAATITAKDSYNNDAAFTGTVAVTVDGNDGNGWEDLGEGSYTVKVNGATTSNVVFSNQISKSIIVELHGTGTTAYPAIRIHVEKSDDAAINGNSSNISINGFSATAVAGAESNGGEGGTPAVEGEQIQGAKDQNLKAGESPTPSPWKQALPYEAAGAVVLLGSGIWWWMRKIGGGIGGGGIKGFMFANLKSAASKIRMFLW